MELQLSSSVTLTPDHGDDGRKKHCWECRRRRLVCDSTQPTCNRCQQARIVCPGYDDRQPLRWLTPGKVTSRNRRPRTKAKAQTNKPGATKSRSREDVLDEQYEVCLIPRSQLVDTIMRFELKCENFHAMKAVYYYTIDVYHSVSPLKGLVSESRLGLPPVSLYRHLPAPLRYMFVSLAMAHHINRLPPSTDRSLLSRAYSVMCYWNGLAIEALNELINVEKTRVSDVTIAVSMMMLYCDTQQNINSNWKYHYDGITRMIKLRGGMMAFHKSNPHMRMSIVAIVVTEALANSTSPHDKQLTQFTHPSQLGAVKHIYADGIFPSYLGTLCPPELLLLIIHINHLRADAAHAITALPDDADDNGQAYHCNGGANYPLDLLRRALAFSPEKSTERAGLSSPDDWILFGRIYQSAVVLYCVLSLRDLGLAPPRSSPSTSTSTPSSSQTPSTSTSTSTTATADEFEAAATAHYDRILPDLKRALDATPRFKSPLLWPLGVAGAAARGGSSFERAWVEDSLRDAASYVGSVVPLAAAGALRRFWDSAREGEWEACWDRTYLLLA